MMPVRCFSCNKVMNKWETCDMRVTHGEDMCHVLDTMGITRLCCRRMYMYHVDVMEDVLHTYQPTGSSSQVLLPAVKCTSQSSSSVYHEVISDNGVVLDTPVDLPDDSSKDNGYGNNRKRKHIRPRSKFTGKPTRKEKSHKKQTGKKRKIYKSSSV